MEMRDDDWQALLDLLRDTEYRFELITPDFSVHRVSVAPGLTDAEVGDVEESLGFRVVPKYVLSRPQELKRLQCYVVIRVASGEHERGAP
jgi:hypothetical protein